MITTTRIDDRPFQFLKWERLSLMVGKVGQEGVYTCRLSDIKQDRLIISRPQYERGNSQLADNRKVTVFCTRADAVYAFSARVKEARPKSSDTMCLMDLGNVRRAQRRRFVRTETIIRMKYGIIPRPPKTRVDPGTVILIPAHSVNLSAGGMLIAITGDVSVNDLFLLSSDARPLEKLPRYMLAACRHTRVDDDCQRVAGVEFILNEDLPRYFTDIEMKLLPDEATHFDDRMQNGLVGEIFSERLLMCQKGLMR